MNSQQKHKPPYNNYQTPRAHPTLSHELRKLVDLWLNNSVDQFYQNKVMAYFDQFQNKEIQLKQIKKQIQLTLKRQSFFFMIRHLVDQKDQLLQTLNKQIQALQKYCTLNNKEEPNLEPACNILNDLRQSHMLIVETIMEFLKKYKIKNNKTANIQSQGQHSSIMACISTDIAFLKDSVLKYYIPFGQQLDALLVQESRVLKRKYKQNTIVYNKNIEKLLTLTPSYMYRLLRAKKNIDKLIVLESEKQDNYNNCSEENQQYQAENRKEKIQKCSQSAFQTELPIDFRTIQQQYSSNYKQQERQSKKIVPLSRKIVYSYKLDNSAYMINQSKSKSRANTRSETIQFFQEKYKSINIQPQRTSQISRTQSRHKQKSIQPETRINKRSLKLEPKQIEKFVQKQRNSRKLKISPPILKIDIKSEINERKESSTRRKTLSPQPLQNTLNQQEIRVFKDEGIQHSPIEIYGKNKRFYLLEMEKDSRIIQQNQQSIFRKKIQKNKSEEKSLPRRLQSIDGIHYKNKVKGQPEWKLHYKRQKNNQSDYLQDSINQKQLNQMQFKETHKNFLHLFQNDQNRIKNEGRYVQKSIKREDDYRKYQNKQLIQEQQQLLQRQKQIISNINKKYRQLAMKEKQYELSKLGHNIFHRMREKQSNIREKQRNKEKKTPTRKYKLNITDP